MPPVALGRPRLLEVALGLRHPVLGSVRHSRFSLRWAALASAGACRAARSPKPAGPDAERAGLSTRHERSISRSSLGATLCLLTTAGAARGRRESVSLGNASGRLAPTVTVPGHITSALREAIEASGLPLAELQRRTGVDRSQLSRFLRGERSLTVRSMDALATELGLRLVYRVHRE